MIDSDHATVKSTVINFESELFIEWLFDFITISYEKLLITAFNHATN